jgi:hypothetical protein
MSTRSLSLHLASWSLQAGKGWQAEGQGNEATSRPILTGLLVCMESSGRQWLAAANLLTHRGRRRS